MKKFAFTIFALVCIVLFVSCAAAEDIAPVSTPVPSYYDDETQFIGESMNEDTNPLAVPMEDIGRFEDEVVWKVSEVVVPEDDLMFPSWTVEETSYLAPNHDGGMEVLYWGQLLIFFLISSIPFVLHFYDKIYEDKLYDKLELYEEV